MLGPRVADHRHLISRELGSGRFKSNRNLVHIAAQKLIGDSHHTVLLVNHRRNMVLSSRVQYRAADVAPGSQNHVRFKIPDNLFGPVNRVEEEVYRLQILQRKGTLKALHFHCL